MPRRHLKSTRSVRTFEELCRGVQETLLKSRRRVEWATVLAIWETGQLPNEHVLLNRDRAVYAERVISRLAKRSGINEHVLYHCAQFHWRFPILTRGSKLVWSRYRPLCQTDDDKQCAALTAQAEGERVPSAAGRGGLEQFSVRPAEARCRRRVISRNANVVPNWYLADRFGVGQPAIVCSHVSAFCRRGGQHTPEFKTVLSRFAVPHRGHGDVPSTPEAARGAHGPPCPHRMS